MNDRWRLVAVWAMLLAISVAARTYVGLVDEMKLGRSVGLGQVLAIEISSHLVVAALLPVLYWLHRRWPIIASMRNCAIHVLALLPFSLVHTTGMTALRLLWFSAILGEHYSFPLTTDRLAYEFAKDIVSYAMLNAGIVGLAYFFDLLPKKPAAVPKSILSPERFAVRRRGGNEIMVEVADIDWIEASGNYAILHVGGDTFEIRSSLAKLESELDPRRFVRVHKSHVVNISRVTEVTPWVTTGAFVWRTAPR